MLIDENGTSFKSFFQGVGNWFKNNWKKVVIGVAVVIAGALITALTAGAGVGFLSAFGSAILSSSIQVGLSTVISAVIGGSVSALNGDNFWSGFANGIADGIMWGGIFAGGAQILSGGFKVLLKLGVPAGRNGGIARTGLFSPNRIKYKEEILKIAQRGQKFYDYGGTLLKLGKYVHLDVGTRSFLHLHLWFTKFHIPIGSILAGIIGGFNE